MTDPGFEMLHLGLEDMKFILDVQFHDAIGVTVDEEGVERHGNMPIMIVRWCTHDQIMSEEDGGAQVETFLLPPETWMSALSAEMLEYASNRFGKEREEVNDE